MTSATISSKQLLWFMDCKLLNIGADTKLLIWNGNDFLSTFKWKCENELKRSDQINHCISVLTV